MWKEGNQNGIQKSRLKKQTFKKDSDRGTEE